MVILIGDDISYNDFGCLGHLIIKTPNIDGLAKNGLTFTNAYLTASSCSPSRVSIMTGRYPHNTGAAELHSVVPADQLAFPKILKENGYYTAQAGKWHLGAYVYIEMPGATKKATVIHRPGPF
ncbi:sulfatase-like hydrolase/transferase [Pedobacter deserti]|uniref:sulfatase-like hydrolase/transferase n=1 Tax=Pedobacter deserti TaxID=2817382 RepID=UPI00210D1623|nr:sulfatase-like hydrolase/transferase [Pedobacter sp. SYSU D00382]